ncbi:protein of unknown function [Streptantibioticus cattleyicolor NRRL 8057 = DSM 46488]|nr:protein of unknown function [Streptantibioticus cattleyicolor NRRL 8057 = DSM 46488]
MSCIDSMLLMAPMFPVHRVILFAVSDQPPAGAGPAAVNLAPWTT